MFKRTELLIIIAALIIGVLNFLLLGVAPIFYLALAGVVIPSFFAIRREYGRKTAHDDRTHS